MASEFVVRQEDLLEAARRLGRVRDDVLGVVDDGLCAARDGYGAATVQGSVERFVSRWAHGLAGLVEDADAAAKAANASACAYDDADDRVARALRRLADGW